VQELPGLVRLAAAHPDRVACLSLAVDYEGIGTPEDVLPAVREFLERVGAGRVINMVSTEESDAIYRKLDLASVPAVYVWRPDGSLAVRFDDDHAARSLGRPFTYDDVEAAVIEQVAALLSPTPTPRDELARALGLPIGTVAAALLELNLMGRAELLPGGLAATGSP
jgi:hypothetical protein